MMMCEVFNSRLLANFRPICVNLPLDTKANKGIFHVSTCPYDEFFVCTPLHTLWNGAVNDTEIFGLGSKIVFISQG